MIASSRTPAEFLPLKERLREEPCAIKQNLKNPNVTHSHA